MQPNEKSDPYVSFRSSKPFEKRWVPEPILESQPNLIDLYYVAWESAWRHVLTRTDMPEPFYMDEAMTPNTIWIWDTCFMAMFSKYAHDIFPGIQSLNNFYYIIHGKKPASAHIHFADNPPLFGWVEDQHYQFTADDQRLKFILNDNHFLQKHFDFMEMEKSWKKSHYVHVGKIARRFEMGYQWRGNTSGMDNTPRGRTKWNNSKFNPRGQITKGNIYWLDLLAQQCLSAKKIAILSSKIGNKQDIETYTKIANEKAELLNKYYWNEHDGIYYDLLKKPKHEIEMLKEKHEPIHNPVPTIASYWPMLAGVCNQKQAKELALKATKEEWFGGEIPYPSLARKDPEYRKGGRYWRGGVWLPTAYMATKALENYGYYEIADTNAEKLVKMMENTYRRYKPHTIWEVYSPSEPEPSTEKHDKPGVRPDFCGWSALGPISMLIENILGFHKISANERVIEWRLYRKERHGIKGLKFGDIIIDLIFQDGAISVESNAQFSLRLSNEKGEIIENHKIDKGKSIIEVAK